MEDIENLHISFELIDILEDHHFDRIYEKYHRLFGDDKDTSLCEILTIDRILNQVACKFEGNRFKVDL